VKGLIANKREAGEASVFDDSGSGCLKGDTGRGRVEKHGEEHSAHAGPHDLINGLTRALLPIPQETLKRLRRSGPRHSPLKR